MDTNLKITDSNGNLLNYTVLITFDAYDKSYVVYTDTDLNVDKELKLYYASYKNDDLSKLSPVETQEEIDLINSVVDDYENDIRELAK